MHYHRREQFGSRHMNTDQSTAFSHGNKSEFDMTSLMTFISYYQLQCGSLQRVSTELLLQRFAIELFSSESFNRVITSKFNLQRFFFKNSSTVFYRFFSSKVNRYSHHNDFNTVYLK